MLNQARYWINPIKYASNIGRRTISRYCINPTKYASNIGRRRGEWKVHKTQAVTDLQIYWWKCFKEIQLRLDLRVTRQQEKKWMLLCPNKWSPVATRRAVQRRASLHSASSERRGRSSRWGGPFARRGWWCSGTENENYEELYDDRLLLWSISVVIILDL